MRASFNYPRWQIGLELSDVIQFTLMVAAVTGVALTFPIIEVVVMLLELSAAILLWEAKSWMKIDAM